jgi:two-component system CheB/CheR fusion protein
VAALTVKDAPDAGAAEVRNLMIDRYTAPAVVIDADHKVVETFGPVSDFLRVPSGTASLDVFKLLRNGLPVPLRRAIYDVRKDANPTRREGIEVQGERRTEIVDLVVVPLGKADDAGRLLVVFERPPPSAPKPRGRLAAKRGQHDESRMRDLEADLEASRTHMAAMIQDLEAANEELQSANEEILSSNEELQSTNEELDTAREELQSTNEEITTVNEELQSRNDELLRANSDLENFIASVPAAIVIVARDLRIRRFTPSAQPLLNLLPSDVGRPLDHIRPNISIPELGPRIEAVIGHVSSYEADLAQDDGRMLRVQIRPYANTVDHIEGAVLSILDVTQQRANEHSVTAAHRLTQAVADAIDGGFALLDADLKLTWVDRGFCALFRTSSQKLLGRALLDLQGEAWRTGARTLLAGFTVTPSPMPRTGEAQMDDGTQLAVEARRLESDADQVAILVRASRRTRKD